MKVECINTQCNWKCGVKLMALYDGGRFEIQEADY